MSLRTAHSPPPGCGAPDPASGTPVRPLPQPCAQDAPGAADAPGALGSDAWALALLQKFLVSRYEDALDREMEAHLAECAGTGRGRANRRNGTAERTLKTSLGKLRIRLPRDREGSFEPVVVTKWVKETLETEWRLLHMYTVGGDLDAVAGTVRAIYQGKCPQRRLAGLAASFLDGVRGWQNRPLKSLYLYLRLQPVPVQGQAAPGGEGRGAAKEAAGGYTAYAFLGCDAFGRGEVLGLWRNDTGSQPAWLQALENLKDRGVEDILFFSMDGMPELAASIASVFPRTLVQPRAESVGQPAD